MRVRWGAMRPHPGAVAADADAAICSPAPHGHRLATAVGKLPALPHRRVGLFSQKRT